MMNLNENKRRCTKCNVELSKSNWSAHLKTKKHFKNDPEQTIKPGRHRTSNIPTKRCPACDVEIINWSRHLKTKKYLENDLDQTVRSRRRNPTKIFTNPRKAHRVFNFSKNLFEAPHVRTVVRTKETAYRNRIQTLEIENSKNFLDARQFLSNIERPVIGSIRQQLKSQYCFACRLYA
jgi:hypothetical protein